MKVTYLALLVLCLPLPLFVAQQCCLLRYRCRYRYQHFHRCLVFFRHLLPRSFGLVLLGCSFWPCWWRHWQLLATRLLLAKEYSGASFYQLRFQRVFVVATILLPLGLNAAAEISSDLGLASLAEKSSPKSSSGSTSWARSASCSFSASCGSGV